MSSSDSPPPPFSSTSLQSTLYASAASSEPPPWRPITSLKMYTLVFVMGLSEGKPSKLLLGLKQRGHGVGLWNGFGGKVEASDESVQTAAKRELQEEAGIVAEDLEYRGRIVFGTPEVGSVQPDIRLFACSRWTGLLTPSEEMGTPTWHTISLPSSSSDLPLIPYGQMHPEIALYLPFILAGTSIEGRFDYVDSGAGEGEAKIERCWIGELQRPASCTR